MIEDYTKYDFTKKEHIQYFMIGFVISAIIAYLFYNSIIAIVFFLPLSFVYKNNKKKSLAEGRKWKLNLEFRDCMLSISAALNAGYSIENAFNEALEEMKQLHFSESFIIPELEFINSQLYLNKNIEELLVDFARRSGVDDISSFAEVFSITKRSGGDMIRIISMCCKNIGGKIEVKREILTLIAAKKFEARIMNFIPFCIILYLWVFSPGFLDPVYHNLIGILFMSVVLLSYYVAFRLSEKIIHIEI